MIEKNTGPGKNKGPGNLKILNLFSGIGCNRKLWNNSNNITSIENNQKIALLYHRLFPNDKIIITNAYDYLLDNYEKYDFIWSSPPCFSHSFCNNFLHAQGIKRYPDLKLYELIIFLKKFCNYNKKNIKWIVENVKPYYIPLINPNFILERHYFWSNINIKSTEYKLSKFNILNSKPNLKKTNQQLLESLEKYHNIYFSKELKKEFGKEFILSCLKKGLNANLGKFIISHI